MVGLARQTFKGVPKETDYLHNWQEIFSDEDCLKSRGHDSLRGHIIQCADSFADFIKSSFGN